MTVAPPILVTGLPRSGTSLVAGILAICGAWTGETFPGDAWNAKGTLENRLLRENVLKPVLTLMGADPLGLARLPAADAEPVIAPGMFARIVEDAIARQGYAGGPWLYKDAKLALCRRQWAEAFPAARWLLVRRDAGDVIASCLRAEPMIRRMGLGYASWRRWHDLYEERINRIATRFTVWPAPDILGAGLTTMEPVVEALGLTWRPREVAEFIDAGLWHGGRG